MPYSCLLDLNQSNKLVVELSTLTQEYQFEQTGFCLTETRVMSQESKP